MNPIIGGNNNYNVQASLANPAETAQTAVGTHSSGHAGSLTLARLSHHALDALNAKETQGDKKEKTLARLAKEAIGSGQLQILSNQPANGVAQFGKRHNEDALVIKAKLNERSEYDILSVGFKRGSEEPVSMTLPRPSTAVTPTARHPSALLGLPNELLLQIAGSTGTRGEGVNLSLRRVNPQMKAIADDQLSPKQRFLVENGQKLHAVGYDSKAMTALAARPAAERDFVLANGQQLHAAGYNYGFKMNALAARPDQRNAFLRQIGQRD